MKTLSLAALAVLVLNAPCLANDTMAEMKTGGLVYVQSEDVVMEKEDLFLSMAEVRVDYVFRNTSDHDVEGVVAFPMPDLVGSPESMADTGDTETDNFLGFSVTQDGQDITPQLDQHVVAMSIDRTEDLRAAGIPLLPFAEKTVEAIAAASAQTRQDLVAKGLVLASSYEQDGKRVTEYTPVWTLRSTYWWKTVFPKSGTVRVSHRYKPSVGGTVGLSSYDGATPEGVERNAQYCVDKDFAKTAVRIGKAHEAGKGPYYTENWMSYVLSTGANWSGPIGHFSLTVDKGAPDNFVSFCGAGVKKVGPTTFRMEATDFNPEKDIDILFLVATPTD